MLVLVEVFKLYDLILEGGIVVTKLLHQQVSVIRLENLAESRVAVVVQPNEICKNSIHGFFENRRGIKAKA